MFWAELFVAHSSETAAGILVVRASIRPKTTCHAAHAEFPDSLYGVNTPWHRWVSLLILFVNVFDGPLKPPLAARHFADEPGKTNKR